MDFINAFYSWEGDVIMTETTEMNERKSMPNATKFFS